MASGTWAAKVYLLCLPSCRQWRGRVRRHRESRSRVGLPERPEKSVGGLQLDGYVLRGEVIARRDLAA